MPCKEPERERAVSIVEYIQNTGPSDLLRYVRARKAVADAESVSSIETILKLHDDGPRLQERE